jgi:hypothetical protein
MINLINRLRLWIADQSIYKLTAIVFSPILGIMIYVMYIRKQPSELEQLIVFEMFMFISGLYGIIMALKKEIPNILFRETGWIPFIIGVVYAIISFGAGIYMLIAFLSKHLG